VTYVTCCESDVIHLFENHMSENPYHYNQMSSFEAGGDKYTHN